MPIRPLSTRHVSRPSASGTSVPTPSTHDPVRAYATRAAVVATTSAAAVLLSVLPAATAAAPVVAPTAVVPALAAAPAVAAPVLRVPDAAALAAAAPVVPAPVVSAPVVSAPVAPVAVSAPTHTPAAPAAGSAARGTAVQNALDKIGSPYRWGATGPNAFDCSGLINWAFEQEGFELPRTSRALSQVGTPVSRDELQPGDLVFFYSPVSHAGIYIGDGQMVHASTSSKPVRISSIEGREFNSARRI